MGSITFTQMFTELGFLLRNNNSTDATDSGRVGRWINDAYTYMCHPSVHMFREMQAVSNATTLATGDNDYSIATLGTDTVVAIRFVTYIQATTFTNRATKRKVRPRPIRHFERITLSTGPPVQYAVDGSIMYINAVPRSNENGHLLRIGYYKEPTVLTGTDTTVLPRYYDRALLKVSQAFAEEDLGDRAKAMLTMRSATQLLNNAKDEEQLEAEDDGFQVEIEVQSAMGF